jgi:Cysteine rich repeat
MVRVSAHAARWAIVGITALATAFPAFSQAPTDAQRSAIRSACRSDYIAHCSSVPPGGMASLQCLQKNMSSLSSSCKTAVNAIEAPAEPKAEAKTPEAKTPEAKPEAKPETKSESKPEAKPEAAPAASSAAPAEKPAAAAAAPKAAAKKPSSAQVAAIRSACRSDYMAHCASVPTGGAAALNCLKQNKSKLSANCEQAVNAAGGGAASGAAGAPAEGGAATQGGAATDAATAAPDAAPAAAPLVLRPMRPREVLFVLRSACGGDVRTLCGDVPPGGGRIVQCLAAQAAQLSPACHDVLGSFAQ